MNLSFSSLAKDNLDSIQSTIKNLLNEQAKKPFNFGIRTVRELDSIQNSAKKKTNTAV
jgi:tRNA(Ser,Leu) C12 N-acetylase TAN1